MEQERHAREASHRDEDEVDVEGDRAQTATRSGGLKARSHGGASVRIQSPARWRSAREYSMSEAAASRRNQTRSVTTWSQRGKVSTTVREKP